MLFNHRVEGMLSLLLLLLLLFVSHICRIDCQSETLLYMAANPARTLKVTQCLVGHMRLDYFCVRRNIIIGVGYVYVIT